MDELPHDRAIDGIMATGYYRDDRAEYELREDEYGNTKDMQ